jgi:CarD family transcriptional regulator
MAQNKTKAVPKTSIKPGPAQSKSTSKTSDKSASTSKPPVKSSKPVTIAKKIVGAAATIKKPPATATRGGKPGATKVVAPALPTAPPKVEMASAKTAPAAKPQAKQPAAKAVVAPKPAVAPAVKAVVAPTVAVPVPPVAPPAAPAPAPVRPLGSIVSRPSSPFNRPPMPGQKMINGRPIAHGPIIAPPKPPAQADGGPKKPVTARHGFKTGETIVYPAHGVGRIVAIEEQEIANISLELFVIQFEKDKMILRVPTGKAQQVGMRKLAEDGIVKRAMETLKGKARIKRTMWSRRAQEFEAKINSGDIVSIAEVVRDLYRADNQPEQSYSERQLYEAALDRMARELAAVEKLDERGAAQRIVEVLSESAKGRKAAEGGAPAPGSDAADADAEEDAVEAA